VNDENNNLYRIAGAEFVGSYYTPEQISRFTLPQVALVGRSNVGKSSLLNAICHQNELARVSKTPGRTQALNFFQVRFKGRADEQFLLHLVDLPGFGYAKVSKSVRKTWQNFVGTYFTKSRHLELVLLLLDCRRETGEDEAWIADNCGNKALQIILTKCDKLSRAELAKKRRQVAEEFGIAVDDVITSSVLRGNRQGLEEVEKVIASVAF